MIEKTVEFVKQQLKNAEGGHDWWHIFRVWNNAKAIAKTETCDLFVVELAALLHDIADPKFYNGDETIAPKIISEFLKDNQIEQHIIDKVIYIIQNMSFKNRFKQSNNTQHSIELQIVQDADRLDAIGAIGIARTFNYGGYSNSEIYNPKIPIQKHQSKEDYKKENPPTINHFYEKLLLLKDKLNTKSAQKIGKERHDFILLFLDQFYAEWNGEK